MSDINETPDQPVQERQYKSKKGRRILAAILVVLFLMLIGVSAFLLRIILPQGEIATKDDAGGLIWVRSIYGWGPYTNQQLLGPVSVAIGPNGTIWTTEGDSGKVAGFNPDGTLRARVGIAKPIIQTATDVGVDPQGRIYIAESSQDVIHVRTADDREVQTLKVDTPMSVTATDDRIIVGSQAGFAILDKDGKPIKIIGTKGTGDAQFDSVNGLAVGENGTIFVSDTYNNRISAYDRNGNRLWIVKTGNPGNKSDITGAAKQKTTIKEEAKLQLPLQLAVDGAGRVIVVDAFDFSLTVLNPKNGRLIAKYGKPGGKDGQFTYPAGVAYDAQRDWFAVADTMNARVQLVRLPDSGGSPVAGIARTLTGPIRACFVPLIILLIALIVGVVGRSRRKAKLARAASTEGVVD